MLRFEDLTMGKVLTASAFALSLAALSACDSDDNNGNGGNNSDVAAFTLSLIHAADMEGNTNAVGDAPRFSAVLEALRAMDPVNSLTVSSGDNFIPSPFFNAQDDSGLDLITGIPNYSIAGDDGIEGTADDEVDGTYEGRADIAMLNAMGFDISTLGNHDFDAGPEHLGQLLASSAAGGYEGANFATVSANLDFSAVAELNSLVVAEGGFPYANSLSPSYVINVNGTDIGVVGAVTNSLASITSLGDVTVSGGTTNEELAAAIQPTIDNLTAQGIDHILLLTHFQDINIERALIPLLNDVDIVVGGGSDAIFADGNDRLRTGDSATGTYPEFIDSADGSPTALVNTDGQYLYVGYLQIAFNEDGDILEDSYDETVSGAYATDDQGVSDLGATPNAVVAEIAAILGDNINAKDGNLFGNSSVFLNGLRSSVRNEQTNMGDLSADANLYAAQQVDASTVISLKNGGGIRAEIGVVTYPPGATSEDDLEFLPPPANELAGKQEGDISQLEIETTLAFNNGLKLFSVTGQELLALLEHGIFNQGNTDGRFPQIGGMMFAYDPTQTGFDFDTGTTIADVTAPSRIQTLAILDASGNVAECIVDGGAFVAGQDSASFNGVTLDFLYDNDGDGYLFSETAAFASATDLTGTGLLRADFTDDGSEQDAFAEYMEEFYSRVDGDAAFAEADTAIANDTRIINLSETGGVNPIVCP